MAMPSTTAGTESQTSTQRGLCVVDTLSAHFKISEFQNFRNSEFQIFSTCESDCDCVTQIRIFFFGDARSYSVCQLFYLDLMSFQITQKLMAFSLIHSFFFSFFTNLRPPSTLRVMRVIVRLHWHREKTPLARHNRGYWRVLLHRHFKRAASLVRHDD